MNADASWANAPSRERHKLCLRAIQSHAPCRSHRVPAVSQAHRLTRETIDSRHSRLPSISLISKSSIWAVSPGLCCFWISAFACYCVLGSIIACSFCAILADLDVRSSRCYFLLYSLANFTAWTWGLQAAIL